jgi:lysophospholipase L1-like esterase
MLCYRLLFRGAPISAQAHFKLVLDIFTPLQSSNIWLQEVEMYDGAHPRAAGYQEIANLVQNWSGWLSWFA